jgi:drug/metabolite transporter (DMT)-like permease
MKLNPYLAVIFAATIGGSGGVFIKLLNLPPTTFTFFRMAVPVVFLLFYFQHKKVQLFRGNYRWLMVASGLNAIRMVFFFMGYLYTTIGNAVIILFTWPIFATLFSAIFLKEKVSLRTAFLIGLAFTGIIIMYINNEVSLDNSDFIGMGAMLLSAILFSVTAVIFKKELVNYSKTETIFYQNIIGAVVFMPFIFINTLPTLIEASVVSLYSFLLGIVAFLLFFYALGKLKLSHYSLFTYWEVVAALIFGVIFFAEPITLNMVIGGGCILASGIILRLSKSS